MTAPSAMYSPRWPPGLGDIAGILGTAGGCGMGAPDCAPKVAVVAMPAVDAGRPWKRAAAAPGTGAGGDKALAGAGRFRTLFNALRKASAFWKRLAGSLSMASRMISFSAD